MEVSGSPARRNLGVFSANLCMYKGLPHRETFVQWCHRAAKEIIHVFRSEMSSSKAKYL